MNGQVPTCEVTGTVLDEQGGLVPGADVALGARHRTVSNADGRFYFRAIPAYTRGLSVRLRGFHPWSRPIYVATAVRSLDVEVRLRAGRPR